MSMLEQLLHAKRWGYPVDLEWAVETRSGIISNMNLDSIILVENDECEGKFDIRCLKSVKPILGTVPLDTTTILDGVVYICPTVNKFLECKDALSTDLTIFKYNGSTTNGKRAISYIPLSDCIKEIGRAAYSKTKGGTDGLDS